MRFRTRFISIVLMLIMLMSTITVAPLSVSATETNDIDTDMAEDLSVSGTNSLGDMLADEYAESDGEETEDTGNNIFELAVENKTAYVDLKTKVDALLLVALYDDLGQQMYASAKCEVTAEDTIVQVDFDVEVMPESFLVKAYLLDKETNNPLCKAFECDTYTAKMQEFLSKTTEDFDEDKVLNLDEDDTNNFLVYNDETILTIGTEDTNVVTSADLEGDTYVIENIDDSVVSLKAGDIFSHSYADGEGLIILKISSITIDGTTATIIGEELEFEDVFDYVKIDIAESVDDPTIDNSNLEEGMEFLGEADAAEEIPDKGDLAAVGSPLIDAEVTVKRMWKYKLPDSAPVEGEFGAGFFVSLSVYYDKELFGAEELEISVKLGYEVAFSLKYEKEKTAISRELGSFSYVPIPGITLKFTPKFVLKGTVAVSFSGSFSGHLGGKFKNGKFEKDVKLGELDTELKIEGTVFAGFAVKPEIEILGPLIGLGVEGAAGVELSASPHTKDSLDGNPKEAHQCLACVQGELYFKVELEVSIEILNKKALPWDINLEFKWHWLDFYFSLDKGKAGVGTCPNYVYRQTITIVDEDGKPVLGAKVNGKTVNEKGQAVLYLARGTYDLSVVAGGNTYTFDSWVRGAAERIYTLGGGVKEIPIPSGSASKPGRGNGSNGGSVVGGVQPEITETGKCGDNVTYTYYSDGRLEISGTGPMDDWTYAPGVPWYSYSYSIKKVTINAGVTSIGTHAFWHCSNLPEIIIPSSVTSIGFGAFNGCESLKSIVIPSGITCIAGDTFIDCKNLTSIAIPESVTSIGDYAFGRCSSLTGITIPSGVKDIGISAFLGCTNLMSIVIPDGITQISFKTFEDCVSLVNITIPDSVKNIGNRAFAQCENLKSITIPDSVVEIGWGAFSDCSSLTNIIIPDGVISIGSYAFSDCSRLTSIEIPDSVTTIGKEAFSYCSSLLSIIIPDSVTSIDEYTFLRCRSLVSVEIPDSVKSIGINAFESCDSLTNISLPESVADIGEYAFQHCVSLTSITIPDSVKSIGQYAFYECNSLKRVAISYGIECIEGRTFSGCTKLENVEIPDSVISIGTEAFDNCTSLLSIVIPDSVTNIGDYAFGWCESLTSITISDRVESIGDGAFYNTAYYNDNSNWENNALYIGTYLICAEDTVIECSVKEGTTLIADGAFDDCNGLADVKIPDSVVEIGWGAFSDCSSLTSIVIPDGVSSIKGYTFYDCSDMTSVTIPDNITYIGDSAFYNCANLVSIVIPDGVTYIGDFAFSDCSSLRGITIPQCVTNISLAMLKNCTSLENVTIPKNIKTIDYAAFEGCTSLTDVYYIGSESEWNGIEIGRNNEVLANATIHYNYTGANAKTANAIVSVGADSDENVRTHTRENLVPDTEAVLVIMEGVADECSISTSPILYIAQTTVDADGIATFTSYGDFSDVSYWTAAIYGQCSHPECEWEIGYDATDYLDGLEIYACTACGEVFDSRAIPAKNPGGVQEFLGDANEDGKVNVKDATQIQKHVAGLLTLTDKGEKLADADGSTKVNVKDATAIQKWLAGIEIGSPIGQPVV